jgi:hypothetical protein
MFPGAGMGLPAPGAWWCDGTKEKKRQEKSMKKSASERRFQPNRRQRSMPFLGISRSHGRRSVGRRGCEADNTYVDRPSPEVVILVIFVVICSALDALLTLLHIQQGGSEANPIMALALNQGIHSFLGLKMTMTVIGALVLAIHQNFWLGLRSLYAMALVYAGLLMYHAVIILSGF